MLTIYQEAYLQNSMKILHTNFNNLNKLDKSYLIAYMSQISSKSVQQFQRRSPKCLLLRSLIKIVNIGHSNLTYSPGDSLNQI